MSPTCVKKPMPNKAFIVTVFALVSFGITAHALAKTPTKSAKQAAQIAAPVAGAVTVSDYEFNTFVFPDTIKRIFFPAGSPVVGKPIYLQDNTQVMLQFAKGQDKPVQMVAELEGGAVVSIRVVPRAVPGVTHAVNGARVRGASAKRSVGAESAPASGPHADDIDLLKKIAAAGEPPAGYDPVALPKPTRFDKFTVVPLAGWSDGSSKRVLIFSLVAVPGQTAVVSPPQFYRPGISAVIVDGDVVDATNSPQLYVVEELNDE